MAEFRQGESQLVQVIAGTTLLHLHGTAPDGLLLTGQLRAIAMTMSVTYVLPQPR